MKAIILAGGYAKRMWPLTRDRPKPLLPVGGLPMIEHVMDKLLAITQIDTIYITTNKRFEGVFREWLQGKDYPRDVRLVVEETTSEEEKLGSIGAMKHIIDKEGIDDDILCMGGDNLLEDGLLGFVDFFKSMGTTVFGLWEMEGGDLCKFGVACLNDSGKVVHFEEKPSSPKSSLISTAVYAIPRAELRLIDEYIAGKNNPDAFGHFISWLYSRSPVHGYIFKDKWFDIGSHEDYEEANRHMEKKQAG